MVFVVSTCGEHLWLTVDQVSSLQLLLKRIMCYDVAPLGGWVWGMRGRGREKVGVYLIDKDLIYRASEGN